MSERSRAFGVVVKPSIVKDGRLLVLYKTHQKALGELDPSLQLGLPGGRVLFGESPVEALPREVAEETRNAIEPVAPVHTRHYVKGGFQLVSVDYPCRYVSGQVVLSDQHGRFA